MPHPLEWVTHLTTLDTAPLPQGRTPCTCQSPGPNLPAPPCPACLAWARAHGPGEGAESPRIVVRGQVHRRAGHDGRCADCGVLFRPTMRQLGLYHRGCNIFCSPPCRWRSKKRLYRDSKLRRRGVEV
jgi:hypothetical protein